MPIGLYAVRPAGVPHVSELVVIQPPEPLSSFLADRGYLPKGVPLLKRVLALPEQTICCVGLGFVALVANCPGVNEMGLLARQIVDCVIRPCPVTREPATPCGDATNDWRVAADLPAGPWRD